MSDRGKILPPFATAAAFLHDRMCTEKANRRLARLRERADDLNIKDSEKNYENNQQIAGSGRPRRVHLNGIGSGAGQRTTLFTILGRPVSLRSERVVEPRRS